MIDEMTISSIPKNEDNQSTADYLYDKYNVIAVHPKDEKYCSELLELIQDERRGSDLHYEWLIATALSALGGFVKGSWQIALFILTFGIAITLYQSHWEKRAEIKNLKREILSIKSKYRNRDH